MYVCLCHGVTIEMVADAVVAGATTSREVSEMCGAGSECGRCRRNIRAIINSHPVTTEQGKEAAHE